MVSGFPQITKSGRDCPQTTHLPTRLPRPSESLPMNADPARRPLSEPLSALRAAAPRHALSFDMEAVHIMEREGSDWAWCGAARFDTPDLATRLATLRRGIDGLNGPGPGRVMLIIPDDQVLFTEFAVNPTLPRKAAVAAGLDGLTPYAVEDLAFDWVDAAPDRVRVAAVWRETLSEAQAFASVHGFEPVAAIADAEGTHFARPVQFGAFILAEIAGDEGKDEAWAIDAPEVTVTPSQVNDVNARDLKIENYNKGLEEPLADQHEALSAIEEPLEVSADELEVPADEAADSAAEDTETAAEQLVPLNAAEKAASQDVKSDDVNEAIPTVLVAAAQIAERSSPTEAETIAPPVAAPAPVLAKEASEVEPASAPKAEVVTSDKVEDAQASTANEPQMFGPPAPPAADTAPPETAAPKTLIAPLRELPQEDTQGWRVQLAPVMGRLDRMRGHMRKIASEARKQLAGKMPSPAPASVTEEKVAPIVNAPTLPVTKANVAPAEPDQRTAIAARDARAQAFHERARHARTSGEATPARTPRPAATRMTPGQRDFYLMLGLLILGLVAIFVFVPERHTTVPATVSQTAPTAVTEPVDTPAGASTDTPASVAAPETDSAASAITAPTQATASAPVEAAPAPVTPTLPAPEAQPPVASTPPQEAAAPVASSPAGEAPPAAAAPSAPAPSAPSTSAAPAPTQPKATPAPVNSTASRPAAQPPTAQPGSRRPPTARPQDNRSTPPAPARPASDDASPRVPRDPLPFDRARESEVTGVRPPDRPARTQAQPAASAPAATAPTPATRPRSRPADAAPEAASPARPRPPERQGALVPARTMLKLASLDGQAQAQNWLSRALRDAPAAPARGAVQIGLANDRALFVGPSDGPRTAQARPPARDDATLVPPTRKSKPAATTTTKPAAKSPSKSSSKPTAKSAVDAALAEATAADAPPAKSDATGRPGRRPPASEGNAKAVESAIADAIEQSPASPGGVALTSLKSSPFPERAPRAGRAAASAPAAGASGEDAAALAVAAAAAARPSPPDAAPVPQAAPAAPSVDATEAARRAERLRLDDELQRQAEQRIRARAQADARVEAQQRAAAEARARAQAEAEARTAAARGQRAAPTEGDNEPDVVAAVGGGSTTASVASNATLRGMDLNRTTLIGVIGAGPASRGLIRLRNGKIVTVRLGDRIDGGPITAIGTGAVTYVKGGRPYQLRMLDGR